MEKGDVEQVGRARILAREECRIWNVSRVVRKGVRSLKLGSDISCLCSNNMDDDMEQSRSEGHLLSGQMKQTINTTEKARVFIMGEARVLKIASADGNVKQHSGAQTVIVALQPSHS